MLKASTDCTTATLILTADQSNNTLLKQNMAGIVMGYGRKLSIGRNSFHHLSVGSGLSLLSTNLNSSDLWFSRQYDQTNFAIDRSLESGEPGLLDNNINYSVSLGGRWHYKVNNTSEVKVGMAIHHLNRPGVGITDSSFPLNPRQQVSVAYSRKSKSNLKHTAHIHVLNQLPSLQVLPGYSLGLDFLDVDAVTVEIGLAARIVREVEGITNDAILISLGIESKSWLINLLYESSTTGTDSIARGNGALEVGLGYYFQSAKS